MFSYSQKEMAMQQDIELDRIVRLCVVLDRTGLSRTTVYRKIQDGTFPPPVKLGKHANGWRESDINRSIADPSTYRDGRFHFQQS